MNVANIGPRERRKRLAFGLLMLALGAALALGAVVTGGARLRRIALAIPFWLAAIGIFQAREKT